RHGCFSYPNAADPRNARAAFHRAAITIALHTFAGVAGPLKAVTPSGAKASRMALVIAGKAAIAPASPHPFTPSGLVVQRVGLKPRRNAGRSTTRAKA